MSLTTTASTTEKPEKMNSQKGGIDTVWVVETIGTGAETVIVDTLRGFNAERMHLYTINPAFGSLATRHDLPHLSVHLDIRSSYPERRLFKQSKNIAESWLKRLQAIRPQAFLINDLAQGKTVDHYRLWIRRMVISHVYFELCYIRWIVQEFSTSNASRLIIMANFITQDDLQDVLSDLPAGKSVVFKVNDIFYTAYLNQQNSSSPKSIGLTFIKYPVRYLAFLYAEYKVMLQNLLKSGLIATKSQPIMARWLLPSLNIKQKSKIEEVHIASGSLSQSTIHYYSMVYAPLFKKLLSEGYSISFVFFSFETEEQSKQIRQTFLTTLKAYDVSTDQINVNFFNYNHSFYLLNSYKIYFSLGENNCPSIMTNTALTTEQKCVLLIIELSLDSYRYVLMHWLLYLQQNPINVLLTLEHDIDEASILKRLSSLVTPERPLTNIVLPSCLPEYSEVYDCVDVDTLYTHHGQIEKLFTDQNVNARELLVSGSTEWEEQPPESVKFDDETQALIDRSDLVIGVFHQPLFLTFHQKEIYDGLIVDFKSIYERFLIEYPTGCLLIKPHRADDLEAIHRFIPPSDRIRVLAKNCSNQLLYRTIDTAISIHSTTVVHTIAHGVPMICLYKYPDYTHFYDFVEQMGCLATNSQDDVFTWLNRFTQDAEFKASVLKTLYEYRDYNRENPASDQIVRQIKELLPLT